MSYQIRIPSTNSDKVGNAGAIEFGTPDSIITFPNESGEVATTSDIPNITVPPPTIYQTDINLDGGRYYEGGQNGTTYEALGGTTITGLEPNYLYKITFTAEFALSTFDIRVRTANGNSTIGGGSYNLWFTATGGINYRVSPGYTTWEFFNVNGEAFLTSGWKIVPSVSMDDHGYGHAYIEFLYQTGTTADQCSLRIEGRPNISTNYFRVWDNETTIVAQPIKSIL